MRKREQKSLVVKRDTKRLARKRDSMDQLRLKSEFDHYWMLHTFGFVSRLSYAYKITIIRLVGLTVTIRRLAIILRIVTWDCEIKSYTMGLWDQTFIEFSVESKATYIRTIIILLPFNLLHFVTAKFLIKSC